MLCKLHLSLPGLRPCRASSWRYGCTEDECLVLIDALTSPSCVFNVWYVRVRKSEVVFLEQVWWNNLTISWEVWQVLIHLYKGFEWVFLLHKIEQKKRLPEVQKTLWLLKVPLAFVCSVFIQLVNIMIIFARWFLACLAEKWVPLRKTLRGYYRYEWPIKFGQSCCWAAGKFRRNLAQIVVEIWFEVARKNIGIGLRHHPNHRNLKFLHVFWMAGWPGLKKVWRQRWKENLYIFF